MQIYIISLKSVFKYIFDDVYLIAFLSFYKQKSLLVNEFISNRLLYSLFFDILFRQSTTLPINHVL